MDINDIYLQLKNNTGVELFGKLGVRSKRYIEWASICHPDSNLDNLDFAQKVFKLLQERANESTSPIIITTKNKTYKLDRSIFASGTVSDIYIGDKLLFKVGRKERSSILLQKEKDILDLIDKKYKDINLRSFVPNLVDSFTIANKRRVNVFEYHENFITLERVKSATNICDSRHIVWIARRMLMSLAILHYYGYAHCAITPDNYLVDKILHRGVLIDYICATKFGSPIKPKLKQKTYYTPEIKLDEVGAGPYTDIYMTGAVLWELAGGHVLARTMRHSFPAPLLSFLRAMIIPNYKRRPDDALELHEQITVIAKKLYGNPRYVKLEGI